MSEPMAARRLAFGREPDRTLTVGRFQADLARLCGPDGGPLLVAVSGGADSLALLLLAHAAKGGSLHVATIDHGLRKEAVAEAAMVAEVCGGLGVTHAVLAGALPPRAGRTANLSARARALRYRLLEEHRLATGCGHVATAHHAEDQVETVALRLNRGAGLAGLAGIRETTGRVVRPLLGWRRAELASLVAAAGLVPVRDPSNVDDRFDRARLRKALPHADWIDEDRWGRSAAALAEAEDALAWAARRLGEERIEEDRDGVTLTLAGEPPEITRRLVADCLVRVDPLADVRGDELLRMTTRLRIVAPESGTVRSTLAGVMVAARAGEEGVVARFERAPPRRSPR